MTHEANTTAVVVGGASGMGLDSAMRLAKRELNLIIMGRDQDKMATAREELLKAGAPSVETWVIDMQQEGSVNAAIVKIEALSSQHVHVRYLVNAAGIFGPNAFLKHTREEYRAYMNINESTFFMTQAIANHMQINKNGGAIVNIGSMWAHQAVKATPSSAYSMAKAGLHSLTQHTAMELAEFGIRVNAVAPAVVKTPIYSSFIAEDQLEATMASFNAFHPIGRIGTPQDVGAVVDFLLSDESSWTTGAVWNVDGGVMAGRN